MSESWQAPSLGGLPEDVLCDALELPPDERSRFIENAFTDQPAQRAELEELLAIAEREPGLLIPPDDPDLPPVLGNYRIVGQCGKGGMGYVYEARDQTLQRRVALKVLPDHLANDAKALANFDREARVLASLSHPNIAVLHSKERVGNIHFLTMEFVEGRTLQDLLRDGPLTFDQVRDYFGQIVAALACAHQQGVVHLDFKPANVMITPEGQVKILDFGISRALQPAPTETESEFTPADFTTPWGTPGYMSPEQQNLGKVDFRTDYWALGYVLYECLSGERIKWGLANDPIGKAHPLEHVPPQTPRPMRRLIGQCIQFEPTARPNGPLELRKGLGLQQSKRPRVLTLAVMAVVLVTAVYYAVFMTGPNPGKLEFVEGLEDNALRGADGDGQTVWVRKGPRSVQGHRYWAGARVVRNHRQALGAAATTYPLVDPSALFFLDAQTGETVWKHDAAWIAPVNFAGPLRYRWTLQARWPESDQPVLVALLRDGQWYSSAVRFLRVDGTEIGTYYHPGVLSFFGEVDTDRDGVDSYLFFGDNSSARFVNKLVPGRAETHCAAVVLLDAGQVDGQAFPYSEGMPEARDWPGMKHAKERAYLLIPPQVDTDSHTMGLDHVVTVADSVGGLTFQAMVSDGRTFFLDAELRPLRYYVGMESSLRKLPEWPLVPDAVCLYMRRGEIEYVKVRRSD